jgi:thiamine pyrophosphate-dependent acetolactate synthase large subunit-like protein
LLISTEKWRTMDVGGNYRDFANAFGVKGFRVEKASDFPAVLAEAKKVTEGGTPALIECIVKEGYDFTHARPLN